MMLFAYLFRRSPLAVFAAVAALVSGVTNTLLLVVLNTAIARQQHTVPRQLVWEFAALCVVVMISRAVANLLVLRLGERTVSDFRLRLSSRILGAPLRQLETLGAPRLLAMLTGDIPVITNAIVLIPEISISAVVVVGVLIYLGWLSQSGLLLLVILLIAGAAGYLVAIRSAGRQFAAARLENETLQGHFRALTDGAKELKMHRERRREFLSGALSSSVERLYSRNVTGGSTYTAADAWGRLLVYLILGLVVFVLPAGAHADLKMLTGFALGLLAIIGPLQFVLNSLPILGRASAAIDRIRAMDLALEASAGEAGESAGPDRGAAWRRLELQGVCHSYAREGEAGHFTVGPIDLHLEPGEVVFLVGGNGSGKTTLAKVLVGLYAPESGVIRLDGEVITDVNREAYRQVFSVVFSDAFVFDSLLGIGSGASPAEVQRHLEILQLAHKVKIEGGALSTTDLSQGQRKRLALLTAYLEDRPIYVFDEWAADQDPTFRDFFYNQILPGLRARGKALLVISHDDRYYGVGDRLVKLDFGQIVEEVVMGDLVATGAAARRSDR
jgi:putative ATP-binding cassette transporter